MPSKTKCQPVPPQAQLSTDNTDSEGTPPHVITDDNEPAMMIVDGQHEKPNSRYDSQEDNATRETKQQNDVQALDKNKRPEKLNLHRNQDPEIVTARREESPTEISSLKNHILLLKEENELGKAEIIDLKAQKETLIAKAESLIADQKSLLRQNEALTVDKKILTNKIESLAANNKGLTTENGVLVADKKVLAQQNKTMNSDKKVLTGKVASLAADNRALTEQKDNLIAQAETLKRENKKMNADLLKREKECQSRDVECQCLINNWIETERNKNITIEKLEKKKEEADSTITHLTCQISDVTNEALCLSTEKGLLEKQLQAEHFGGLLVHFKECHNNQKLDLQVRQLELINHLLDGTAYKAQRSIHDQNTFDGLMEVKLLRREITNLQKDLLTEIFNHWVNKGKP